jgi:arsenate reductase
MAEGLLRVLGGNDFEVFSAGTEQTRVHPLAIHAMQEIGIDDAVHRTPPTSGIVLFRRQK